MNIIFLSIFIFLFNLIIFVKFETISKNFIFFDKPDGVLKKHKKPTSLIGGLIILINTYLIIFFLKVLELDNFFDDRFIYFIITISTFFFLIGFIDDLKNLSPNKKLFWIIFAIGLICIFIQKYDLIILKFLF